MARALAADPPILLMDEPYSAVDPIVRQRLQDELLELHDRLGTTIVFVTHDIDEAIKLGDRIAVLAVGGRLARYAPPAELLAEPGSAFVEEFLGGERTLRRLALVCIADLELDPVDATAAAATDGHDRRRRARRARRSTSWSRPARRRRGHVNGEVAGVLSLATLSRAVAADPTGDTGREATGVIAQVDEPLIRWDWIAHRTPTCCGSAPCSTCSSP